MIHINKYKFPVYTYGMFQTFDNLKKMRGFTLLILLTLSLQFNCFSQTVEVTKTTRIEKIDGKEYYIHTVIKGQTLYSLSKVYHLQINELVFENPEVIDGIKPGMEVKIPVNPTTSIAGGKDKPIEISGKNRIHIVEKGQTMYSISRMYSLSVHEIMQANPGISETLSLGQKLNIPVEQLVKPGETVLISADIEKLKDTNLIYIDTNSINVVMLLPLYLNANKMSYGDTTGNTVQGSVYAKSFNGLEFYEGALLAADLLSKSGAKASIYTYDIPDDAAVTNILGNPLLKKADIIIGPFYGKWFETVAAFAKENNIACVSPVLRKNDIADSNRYVSKVLPSDETQLKQTGDFIGRWHCKKNIIVVHTGNPSDSMLIVKLREGIKNRCDSAKVHIINTKGKSVRLVDSLIQPNVENIVVVFSKDESYVSRLVLYLEKKNSKQRVVTLFGQNEWQDFENIEVEYFQNLNLHIPLDLFVDYNRSEVKDFLLKFRDKYDAEPGKFAYLGYDVTSYYMQMLQKYGNNFFTNPAAIHATGLQSNFDFKKVNEQGGLENQCTFILNYNDYRLVKVN